MLRHDGEPRRLRLPWFETRGGRRLLGIGVVAGVLGVIVIATLRPAPFRDATTYWAAFDSAHGIGKVDRDIRIAGTNVGDIGEVIRTGDDVLVELIVEGDIPVHEDARADLRPHTLFEGSAFIDLHPGSPSAPLLGDGGTIPRRRTRVYVSLDEALRVLHRPTREALRELADAGAKTLRADAIEGIQRTLRAAPELTRELGPTARALRGPEGGELAGAIAGLSQTARAVASRERDLIPLARDTRVTLAALATDGGAPLDASLAALPGVLEELRAGGERLERVVALLDSLAVELRPGAAELGPLLLELQPLLRESIPVLRRSLPLVTDLRTVLERATRAAPAIREVLVATRPGAKVLVSSVLPFLNADSRLGMPAYLQLIAAFTGGAAEQRPYQTLAQNPNGAGHVMRLAGYFDPAFFSSTPFRAAARDCSAGDEAPAAVRRRLRRMEACR